MWQLIVLCLSFGAVAGVAGMLLIFYLRYRNWEKEQIQRVEAWKRRSEELLKELNRDKR